MIAPPDTSFDHVIETAYTQTITIFYFLLLLISVLIFIIIVIIIELLNHS